MTWVHPWFLKAKAAANKEDNPNWWDAMNGPFKAEYWIATCTETRILEGMDAWEVFDKTGDMNMIQSILGLQFEAIPRWLIKKLKARFGAHGGQQLEGIDSFKTYAPVVQWTTVWLLLILKVQLELKPK